MATLSQGTDVGRLIERQMRNWELARSQHDVDHATPRPSVADFVTISRAFGSGGGKIGHLLAEYLGWPVFDRELLQAMADNDGVRKRLYQSMDERDLTWFEETMRSLTLRQYTPNDYFRRLTETVLTLARQGPAVFVGRAADLILPAEAGLRVRIVAPLETRVRNLVERQHLAAEQAQTEMQRIDAQRRRFVRDHFNVDWDDPTRHDLIINLQRFSDDQAIGLIVSARRMRSGGTSGAYARD